MGGSGPDGSSALPRGPRWWAVAGAAAVVAAVLIALALGLVGDRDDDAIHEAVSEGRSFPAPQLDLDVVTAGDLGGTPRGWWDVAADGRLSLDELRGNAVVINFWAPRCTPCREDARGLERVFRDVDADVVVLGIGLAPSSARTRDFVHGLGLSFPQVHDGTGDTARRWGVDGVPETFFVTRDGQIVGHVVGAASAAHFEEGVAAAVTGRIAGLRAGGARDPLAE